MPYCITHNDLDGLGCAILMEKVFDDMKTFVIDYRELDELLPGVLEAAKTSKVFITDIALNEEQAALCDAHGNVQHIDHHSSTKPVSDKYPWSMTDVSHCATYHLFKMLSQYATLEDYREFVQLVDDYDTWGHGTQPSEVSKDLNRLLSCIGKEDFVRRFVHKANPSLSKTEEAIITVDRLKEMEYLEYALTRTQAMTDKDGNLFLMVAAEQYTSSLGNYLLGQFKEAEYVLILNMLEDKASLRSKGKVDVGELAKSCGGGGHPKAAGFMLNEAAVQSFWRGNDEQRERGEPRDSTLD